LSKSVKLSEKYLASILLPWVYICYPWKKARSEGVVEKDVKSLIMSAGTGVLSQKFMSLLIY
jgi:hypothetical protein